MKNITFKDECPAKDICEESNKCLMGNFDKNNPKDTIFPYVPIYVTSLNADGYCICTVHEKMVVDIA